MLMYKKLNYIDEVLKQSADIVRYGQCQPCEEDTLLNNKIRELEKYIGIQTKLIDEGIKDI